MEENRMEKYEKEIKKYKKETSGHPHVITTVQDLCKKLYYFNSGTYPTNVPDDVCLHVINKAYNISLFSSTDLTFQSIAKALHFKDFGSQKYKLPDDICNNYIGRIFRKLESQYEFERTGRNKYCGVLYNGNICVRKTTEAGDYGHWTCKKHKNC